MDEHQAHKYIENALGRDKQNLTNDMHKACQILELDENLSIWSESFPPSPESLKEIEEWSGVTPKKFLDTVEYVQQDRLYYAREYAHQEEMLRMRAERVFVALAFLCLVAFDLITIIAVVKGGS